MGTGKLGGAKRGRMSRAIIAAAAVFVLAVPATGVAAYDRTILVSVQSDGGQTTHNSTEAAASSDGRFVAFSSFATNLAPGDTNKVIDAFVRDRVARTTQRVSVRTGGGQGNGASQNPSLSADGRFVAFQSDADNLVSGDTNQSGDVFVHD